MIVGAYQNCPVFGQTEANIEDAVLELFSVDADLVVLPELFNTGYQFASIQEVEDLAEEVPSGRTCQAMMDLARDRDMSLVFGLPEKDGKRLYNSAVVVGPRGLVGKYRKAHLFAEEKDFFDMGDTGFQAFDLGHAKIGVMICFDWLFPESARVLALLGADIICHPANLVLPYCQKAMQTRSLENGVFTITANRVGAESRGGRDPLVFTGQSQITDNKGMVIAGLGENDTGVLLTEIDPWQARNKRITEQNDRIKDRHPEFYGLLINRT